MSTIINTNVSESRSVARVWIEGNKLACAGVEIGISYMARLNDQLGRIELVPAPADFKGKTYTVSKRTLKERIYPLLEIRDDMLIKLFKVGTKVRVAIQNGRIVITASHIAQRVKERVDRFINKIKNREPLSTTSLFHGGGILDKALHAGFKKLQLDSVVNIAIEFDGQYLDSSIRNNPELFSKESTFICGDIREINLMGSNFPTSEILTAGIPCTGASLSGKAKNGLSNAEEHNDAGDLFFHFLNFVKALNPVIIVIENVVEYLKSVSMTVIRKVLSGLGYVFSEETLSGFEHGSLENRYRMCLVASTPGACDPIDFSNIEIARTREAKVADILDDIPASSSRWKTYSYLADKAVRDKAAGKGFARQLLTGDEDHFGVIGAGYAKARSTEPFIIAKHDPNLSRLLNVPEHARGKTIPESAVEGLSDTKAHEVLGQSVIFCVFVAVGLLIAKTIKGMFRQELTSEETAVLVA
tara:strand:+ start:21782 stop:23197 length:1416 start_codon:yes stop_codon:yes gene_type:complete